MTPNEDERNKKLDLFYDIITENDKIRSQNVSVKRKSIHIKVIDDVETTVSYLESYSPENECHKTSILLLAGQSFTSTIWSETKAMQIFSTMGYHCVAIDLPGTGKTTGHLINDRYKGIFISKLLDELGLGSVVVVVASMSGSYVLPILPDRRIITIVAVGVSDTKVDEANRRLIPTPCLIMWGERDITLGPLSQKHLKVLKVTKEVIVPRSFHACYESNPNDFQKIVLNWISWVVKNY
uniref:AB hydrolase-1 domain-containing protein n=1 Tax=Strongyloides venezuelensis TaxID=75913 RepID=A0A0K0FF59_STRVS